MKIAISGAPGSGKTTACYKLLSAVKERGINCGFANGAARQSHLLMRGDFSEVMHGEIFSLHLTSEMRAGFRATHLICERSIFDFLAYASCRFKNRSRDAYLVDAMIDFSVKFAQSYDLLFLTKGTFGNLDNDAQRVHNVDVAEFDEALLGHLERVNLMDRVHILPDQNRHDFILSKLGPLFEIAMTGG